MTAGRWLAGLAGLALLGSGLAACSAIEPDVGPLLTGACANADSNPAVVVSFATQIRPILSKPMGGCGCHVPAGGVPGPATQITGLDLSSATTLKAGGHNSGSQIAIPMQPCTSVLYEKVEDAPPFGSRMPLGGPPYLSEDEITLIHDWIAEGALDN